MQQRSPWEQPKPSRRTAYWAIIFSAGMTAASLVLLLPSLDGPPSQLLVSVCLAFVWPCQLVIWSRIYRQQRGNRENSTGTDSHG